MSPAWRYFPMPVQGAGRRLSEMSLGGNDNLQVDSERVSEDGGARQYSDALDTMWIQAHHTFAPQGDDRNGCPRHVRWINAPTRTDDSGDVPLAQGKWAETITAQLSTLDPLNLTNKDIVDLSGRVYCYCTVKGPGGVRLGKTHLTYRSFGRKDAKGSTGLPFPPATRGVFYFHDRTNIHPVAGDVRFRAFPPGSVQNSDDIHDLFVKGHDLLDHTGLAPWHISLLSVIYWKRPGFYTSLKNSGYITDEAEEEVERLRLACSSKGNASSGLKSQIVERFTDPFIMDLSLWAVSMVFLAKEGIIPHSLPVRAITTVNVKSSPQQPTYSGTILVRFEMIEHRGGQQVVLRVLKFLKPPNPDDLVVQKEGELLKKWSHVKKREQVWMAAPRTKWITPSSLKMLEETYLRKNTV
ncbi:hypothetical protein NMY22_g2333 [Coprinellus aureogranulatus]|nr:hypothetical protein NMY22_g2333 [Coprinellus aureogranulatus]